MGIVAYFNCFSGISGNMILGALVDAGLDRSALAEELAKLNISDEFTLSFTKAIKHGITATKAEVALSPVSNEIQGRHDSQDAHEYNKSSQTNPHNHIHRKLAEVFKLIDSSRLARNSKDSAKKIFNRLAQAEAKIHNTTKDNVYLHEVSAVDSIVDIVGSVISIELLGIQEIYASPLSIGCGGFVKCAHGILPVPAPATLELLKQTPIRQTSIEEELVTPTGAAIIGTFAKEFGTMPEMMIQYIGYGSGRRDLVEQPNLLRVVIGEKR